MASDKEVRRRRRYDEDLRRQVMAECEAPDASVAKVAMAHGINANVVHRWRQLAREGSNSPTNPVLAPLMAVGQHLS